MDEIIGLPADVTTALVLIVTVVIIPPVTALLSHPKLRSSYKRALVIALAFLASVIIVWFRAGGPFVEQVYTWVLTAAVIIGGAQSIYALMPNTWKQIEASVGRRSQTVESYGKEE